MNIVPLPVCLLPAARDRKFYTGMAIAMLFTACFRARTWACDNRHRPRTVHMHALLFTVPLVLFIVQMSGVATHGVTLQAWLLRGSLGGGGS